MYSILLVVFTIILLFASTVVAQKMDDRKYRRYNEGTGHHRRVIHTK